MKIINVLALGVTLLISGCAKNYSGSESGGGAGVTDSDPIERDVSPTALSYPPADWDQKPDGKKWTELTHIAVDEFGAQLLNQTPVDITEYCPRYDSLNPESRRAFWVYLLSRLARFESNQDPSVSYTESFNDAQGSPVVSRGLLQLSKESANGYGCGIDDEMELHDPAVNIQCAVRILNRWVGQRDGVVAQCVDGNWRGAARYWSPFRNEQKRQQLAADSASQSDCR